VPTLSAQLVTEFGMGFAEKNLRRMVQFAEVFPDEQIVVTLSRQLGWSHFVAIIPLNDDLKRDFYAEMKSPGRLRSTRSRLATATSISRTHTPLKKTMAIRLSCWPSWRKAKWRRLGCATG